MYGVFIPDADSLRGILDRPQRLLQQPFCGYLIYLARSVDGSAARFLEEFGAAVDTETGEALAFLVLLDSAILRGSKDPTGRLSEAAREYPRSPKAQRGWPPPGSSTPRWAEADLPILDVPETTAGSMEVNEAVAHRVRSGSIPAEAFYRANPEWSLKFAAHIGLNRDYLPCIVALDDPGASPDDICAIVSLADPKAAWATLIDAISTYVAQPDTQTFMQAAERARSAERAVTGCGYALDRARRDLRDLELVDSEADLHAAVTRNVAGLGHAARIIAGLPPSSNRLLGWAAALPESDRRTVAEAAQRADVDGPGAGMLRVVLDTPEIASAARVLRQMLRRLRNTWLRNPGTENPHISSTVRAELTAALEFLGRSQNDLNRLLAMDDATDRQAFLALLESQAPFAESEIGDCWSHLKRYVTPEIPGVVRDEQFARRSEAMAAAEQRANEAAARYAAARSTLASTPMSSFVPHLARAAGAPPGQSPVRRSDPPETTGRGRVAMAAGGTAFLADVVQILQGIGVLR